MQCENFRRGRILSSSSGKFCDLDDEPNCLNGVNSDAEDIMAKRYSPHSGNEGDDETDPNIDFPERKSKILNNRYNSVMSSIGSLDGDQTDSKSGETKLSNPPSNNNEGNERTLPRNKSNDRMFNIVPTSANGHSTFIPSQDGQTTSRESSTGFSCDQNTASLRDTDSDNNRQRAGVGEYHSSELSRPLLHPRAMHMSESFSHPCHYCLDNQSQALPHSHHSHQGSSCSCTASGMQTPTSFSHYHQNIPHQLTRSHPNSKYHSGSYEPPWDLVYPSLSQLGGLPHHNMAGQSHPNNMAVHHDSLPPMHHDNMCAHNSAANNTSSIANTHSPYRASNSLVSRSMSNHDRLGTSQPQHAQQRNNTGMNTLATTTGSHSYETPWDMGDSSKNLAYWQSRQSTRKLHDSIGSSATVGDRHIPPPSSPPPPPPEVLRRPVVHYDGAALAQANLVQHLPQKKRAKRRCNWRCIGIFLMLAIVILAGCVAAFTYLLVEKENSTDSLTGASLESGRVTDGNVGDRHRSEVPPYDFVKVRFFMVKSEFYKFNISLGSSAIIGVYGRRSLEPTHIQYDFVEAVKGKQVAAASSRRRRSTESTKSSTEVNTAFVRYLDGGYWYISFYNDGNTTQSIRFTITRHDKMATDCPNDCYGKGDCTDGVCRCYPGYHGVECNLNVCPVLCSGNGVYEDGVCKCFDSWKGSECAMQAHQCNECIHGRCVEGECMCEDGWRGDQCNQPDCPVSDCSQHGICYSGRCYCEMGYRGIDCSVEEMRNFTIACSNDCSGHGVFQINKQICECEAGWHGRNCELKQCNVECINGHCYNGQCLCDHMWEGVMCHQKQCDRRCNLHGHCDNGTCSCQPGWNGRHCTLAGCPNDCNSQGNCVKVDNVYSCSCNPGWKGQGCDIATELQCNDKADNDNDKLVDCFDPDCCATSHCSRHPFCKLAPEPTSVLQFKPRLSTMASFYDSKRFLVEGGGASDRSIQTVADLTVFHPKRVSVIRGTVLLRDGTPALGTRVELPGQLSIGYTLTRENGTFDLMVNGGGSVTVRFGRGWSSSATATVILGWNTFTTLDPVTLLQDDDEPVEEPGCKPNHDRYKLYPVVLPTWQHTQLRACPERSAVIPESQVAQESISIPNTQAYLIYKTSDTSGYQSTVLIQLTPRTIPETLALVHLRVSVEGVVHSELFEADPSLTFRFSWNRQNAYQQDVYGIVTAHVAVGYQYADCEKIFWDKQATTLSGFLGGDLSSSDRSVAKGWSLDIQHFYNYQEGILHKGDGTNVYLKEKPQLLRTVLGNGTRRNTQCNACNGNPVEKQLLAPVAVASDLDGAVYVADYNVIRRLSPTMERVQSVLELSGTSMSYRYYMTVSPTDGKLYLTDFQNKQVLRMNHTDPSLISDINTNFEVIAGTRRVVCIRGTGTKCGDGGDAKRAKLTSPKGIAVNSVGEVYFVDDTTIRKIGRDGIITTVIGSQDQPGQYVAMPCGRAADLYEVFLGWPTSIAFSPIDGSLHILDSSTNLILKVTSENKVAIVAGRPSHCPEVLYKKAGLGLLGDDHMQSLQARNTDLVAVKAMTFAPNGNLYIIESDEETINRVRVISTDGYISHYAGGTPTCNCQMPSCQCWKPNEPTAVKALLNNPSSLTVTPDGVLYIADMGNLRVHSVVSVLPEKSVTKHFDVISAEDGQVYRFDSNGFHVRSTDIMTNTILYNFTMYPPNSLSGSLEKVSAKGGQLLSFARNQEGRVRNVTVNGMVVGRTRTNENGELSRFISLNGLTTSYNYELNTGLLLTKQSSRGQMKSGEVYFYEYDNTGRMSKVTLPTGETTELRSTVDSKGAEIALINNGVMAGTATFNGNSLSLSHGMKTSEVTYSNDGSIVIEYPSGLVVTVETGAASTLVGETPTAVKRKIISSVDGPVHRMEWRYYLRRQNPYKIGRKLRVSPAPSDPSDKKVLRVNGDNLLHVEYLEDIRLEVVKDYQENNIMQIIYSEAGQPTFLAGNTKTLKLRAVNITYNRNGEMVAWEQGDCSEHRTYTSKGQLQEVRLSNLLTTTYTYTGNSRQPSTIELPSDATYELKYDSLGNLIQLVTPGGRPHSFQRSVNLGFTRKSYIIAGNMYIEDYISSGQLVRQIYPNEYRKVYRRYTVDGRPSEILYDSNRVGYTYHPETYSLTNISLSTPGYDCVLSYATNGSLYHQHWVKVNSKRQHMQFADTQFTYKYNKFLRVVKITGTLLDGSRSVPLQREYDYDENRGYLSKVGSMDILREMEEGRPKVTLVLSKDADNLPKLKLIRRVDSSNLLAMVQLVAGEEETVKYQMTYTYDSLKRIVEWSYNTGTINNKVEYEYGHSFDVTKETVAGGSTYRYRYNRQGTLSQVVVGLQAYSMALDGFERVTSYRGHNYAYDRDGFIVGSENVKYQFNSLGQLTHVLESGKIDVTYFYDSIGRLVTRKDNYGSTVQLIYSNAVNPSEISHVYNFTSRILFGLLYDDQGHLIAVENGQTNEKHYVVSDSRGTPIAVFDDTPTLVKSLTYTAYGEVTSDTAPNFNIFLGYHGGFYDPLTKLLLLSERWYYPQLARWMDPGLASVFERMERLAKDPTLMNGYKLHQPINIHLLDREAMYMRDISSWLPPVGYNLEVLAPRITFEGKLSGREVKPNSERALLPLVSAFQCAYEKDMENFLELSLVPRHNLLSPITPRSSRTMTPAGSLFSNGIVLSVDDHRLRVKTHGSTPSQETLLATRVLDGAYVLGLNYTFGGKVVHYMLKSSSSALDDDLKTMGMAMSSNLYLESGVRVLGQRPSGSDGGQLTITGNTTVINIEYGVSREQEVTRILNLAKQRAVQNAWLKELQIVNENRRSSYPWTSAEINELKHKGKISGYSYELIRSTELYPELADSADNVKFIKL